jgi:hypothetical protein
MTGLHSAAEFVLFIVLFVICVVFYYASGGDKED